MILSAIFFRTFVSGIIPDRILFTTGVNVSGFLYTLSDTALFRTSTIVSYIGLFFLKLSNLFLSLPVNSSIFSSSSTFASS